MKSSTKKIIALIVLLVTVLGAYISFQGLGPVKSLNKELKYGLDINGGVYVLLQADTKEKGTSLSSMMDQTKTVLENRVNAMGVSEASVAIEGTDKIRVEMPGVKDAETAIKQIGKTAQLRFLMADGSLVMNGDSIKDAGFTTDSQNGGYKITMDFTADGSDKFANATEKAASGTVAATMTDENGQTVSPNAIVITLDNKVISAPTVSEKINSRSCEITHPNGGFTQNDASQTSALIKGGALPASLTEVNSSVETATIGADALNKSVKAGAIGLLLVFIIMVIAFGALGFVADFALIIYVEIVLWIMAGLGAVLTLPGIAGIILSIGMAVDSNVIIFTRIREEITKGKSIRVAVDSGFKNAMSTVIDSQTTTLIAAFVLYLIGTTSVKGFALTLMIGTICSIITAVFISRLLISIMADSKFFSKLSFFGMKEDGTPKLALKKKFNFIENRKKFYVISLCVIIIGSGFAVFKGFNFGIDFTGGTTIQMDMGKKVDTNDLKKTISKYNLNPTIVYAGENNHEVVIKTIKALKSDDRTKVINTIKGKYNLGKNSVLASEEFGPTVGKELQSNAVKAITIAALCMLVYIRFRFKNWKYGLAAVGGLVHDVLITLSLYAIFGFTINNPFIAGILTVVGYSINDTIVVFDRIRENNKFFKRKDLVNQIDTSINETLSRSLMTSLTTLIVMVPLFIFVSSELRQFLIPLIIGVTAGTYSSIFICSPLYYEMTKKSSKSRYTDNKEKAEKSRKKNKTKLESEGIIK